MTETIQRFQNQIMNLTEKVKTLELGNDNLKQKNNNLSDQLTKITDIVNDNGDLLALKRFCIDQVDEVAKESENNYEKLENVIKQKTVESVNNESIRKVSLELPKFKGLDSERPMKFISDVTRYVNYIKPNFNELLCIIAQSLEDSAKNWWYLQEDEIESFDDFVDKFKNKY